ncbi:MAG: hypothetical protein SAK29_35455 [Scytonema sp. PMC 1069.18]|nr:hypothetical protein [Scytonema sp. PMC 1069.18]MEC4883782.1 hypothetical protein [Scytonema sp. PMC 1070.18]
MKLLQNIVKTLGVVALAMTVLETPTVAATLVRKNVVDLTTEEKADFVDAIKTLKTLPGSNNNNVSLYDEIVAIHTGAMGFSGTHLGGLIQTCRHFVLGKIWLHLRHLR